MLSVELAEEIVRETMDRVNRNINMMDETGRIIASGDASRIGQRHEAAAVAIRENRVVRVDESAAERYPGVQIGINLPIRYQDRIIGAIGITGQPEEVEPLGELIKMTTELMIRQNDLKLQGEWRQLTIDAAIDQLLHGPSTDLAGIRQRLDALRLTFEAPFRLAIIAYSPDDLGRDSEDLLPRIISMTTGEPVIVSRIRPHMLVLLFSRANRIPIPRWLRSLHDRLAEKRRTLRIAVGNEAATIELIRASYAEASMALPFATSGESRADIVYFDEIEARALTGLIPHEHAARLWHKIAGHWNGKMTETITHFCRANLSIAEAAESLGIHRNTMIYRLEQIKTLTGYDPRRFEHAMLLQIALWHRETTETTGRNR